MQGGWDGGGPQKFLRRSFGREGPSRAPEPTTPPYATLDRERNEVGRSESNGMNEVLSRRDVLTLTGAGLAGVTRAAAYQSLNQAPNQPPKKLYAYVSSWTKGPFGVGGGGGIRVFTVNMNDGSLTPVSRTGPEFDGLNGGGVPLFPHRGVLFFTDTRKHAPQRSPAAT